MLEITNGLLYLVHRRVAKDHVASIACRLPSLRLLYIQVQGNKIQISFQFNHKKKETYYKNC